MGLVAARALQRRMRAVESEVGQVVCEAGLVELADVSASSEVLRVTTAALTRSACAHAAVIPPLAADVRSDFLVTIQAERRLTIAVRAVVAVAATAFQLRVGLAHGSRHDQLLDRHGPRCLGGQGEYHEKKRLRVEPENGHCSLTVSRREPRPRERCRPRSA